jgi:hypothetical protein
MITEAELLSQIEKFCADRKLTETAFGMMVLGDFSLVDDLRTRARSPRLKTVRKIIDFMETYNQPKGAVR